jgi:hypothetical protein
MIDFITVTLSCGVINFLCIIINTNQHRLHNETEKSRLCEFVDKKPDWCKSKITPIYPTLKKDRT